MLVTKSPKGELHARTMAPAEITPDWKFRFIYDRDSYKDKEVDNESVLLSICRLRETICSAMVVKWRVLLV